MQTAAAATPKSESSSETSEGPIGKPTGTAKQERTRSSSILLHRPRRCILHVLVQEGPLLEARLELAIDRR